MPYNGKNFYQGSKSKKNSKPKDGKAKGAKAKAIQAKKKQLKATKLAKKKVAKIISSQKKDIGSYDVDQLEALHSIALQAIRKKRRKEDMGKIHAKLSRIIMKTPYKPTRSTEAVDFFSFEVFTRVVAEHISMKIGNFFNASTGIAPGYFRLYCFAILLIYLKKVGKVEGSLAQFIPEPDPSYRIPLPVAKWLQYIAPCIHLGSRQITEFVYNDDFQIFNLGIGDGDGFGTVDPQGNFTLWDYTGSQATFVFPLKSVSQTVPFNNTVPADQPSFPYTTISATSLSVFMSTPGTLGAISTALQNFRVKCVDFSWLPEKRGMKPPRAPDGSAYAALNQSNGLNQYASLGSPTNNFKGVPLGWAWVSIHDFYDAELACLFNLAKQATTQPNMATKPIPMCKYDYNSKYNTLNIIPWYIQIHYVAVWLAFETDNFHRMGWKSLEVNNARLKTLFPTPRFVGGYSFFTLVVHAYQEIQISQSLSGNGVQLNNANVPVATGNYANEDQKCTNWWYFVAAAAHSWQRRFNEQQVVFANSGLFSLDGEDIGLWSQSNYVDSTAQEIELPKTIAHCIDAMGAFIKDGELFCPATRFANLDNVVPSPPTVTTAYGPIGWSAFGFTPNAGQAYPYQNIQSMPVANPSSLSLVPVAAKLDYLTLNTTYVNSYLGWVVANNTLFPFFLGGQWLQKLSKQNRSWISTGNIVNTMVKNFVKPDYPKLGNASVMNAEIVLDFGQAQLEPLIPNNLVQTPKFGPPTSTLSVMRIPIVGAASQMLNTADTSLLALVESTVADSDQFQRTDTANRAIPTYMTSVFTGTPPAAPYAGNPPNGLYNVQVKAANSFSEVIAELTNRVMAPDSNFANEKKKISCIKTHASQIMPKDKVKQTEQLNTNAAYRGEASTLISAAFGDDLDPQITAETVPGSGKAPQTAATNIAVLQSIKGVSSAEETPPKEKSPPEQVEKKTTHKKLKKMADDLDKAGKQVGKAMDSAVEAVGGITDKIGKAVDTLGAFAL